MPKSDQLPHALYRAGQVRALDRQAIDNFGISGEELMERAGAFAFRVLRERWPEAARILVLTGIGNNAGDGFVLARLAQQAGLDVGVLQLGDCDRLRGEAAGNARRWRELGGAWDDAEKLPESVDVIVDAMFGTGLQRDVVGQWAALIEQVNASRRPVLALDIPSGLHADTGVRMGAAIRAEVTTTFIGLKQGMFTGDGPDHCGDIVFDALDVPARVYASQILAARRIDWRQQSTLLTPRRRTAHKGHFGHVLVVGGDLGFGGAARLAAEAALRCGAGLVSLATREAHVCPVLATRPEIMVRAVEHADELTPMLRQADCIVIGPGLGTGAWGRAMWQQVLDTDRPKVVDADGLNLLAEQPAARDNWILTPHPGEASRLLSVCTADVHADRFATAGHLVARFGGVVVLKGAGSLVAAAGQKPPAVCTDGNPGMASGGMGDVLSGVLAALLAQGWSGDDAACIGVCLHAAAADRAAAAGGERGLLAGDLMPWLHRLVNDHG